RGLLRVDVRDAQVVRQAREQLLLGFVEVALRLLLEHAEDIDQMLRRLEVERVRLTVGRRHLAEGDQRRGCERKYVGRKIDRTESDRLVRHGGEHTPERTGYHWSEAMSDGKAIRDLATVDTAIASSAPTGRPKA